MQKEKGIQETQKKPGLFSYLAATSTRPSLLILLTGIVISAIPACVSVPTNGAMLLNLLGLMLSLYALKEIAANMPQNR